MTPINTSSNTVKIDAELLEKIRYIAKSKGQTITGYIRLCLEKQVAKDWMRFNK
jgi:predicted DNA-binding protein